MWRYGNVAYPVLITYYGISGVFHFVRVRWVEGALRDYSVKRAISCWAIVYLVVVHYVLFVAMGILW